MPYTDVMPLPYIIVSLAVLILINLVYFIFRHRYISPLSEIEEAIKKIGGYAFQTRLDTTKLRGDKRLGESLNIMATNLQNYFQNESQNQNVASSEIFKLSIVLASISESVIATNSDKKIILFNHAAENLLGLHQQEVIGKTVSEIMKVTNDKGEVSDLIYCPSNEGQSSEILFSEPKLKVVSSAKVESFVDMTTKALKQNGKNLGCLLILRDITKEQELENMKFDFVSMAAHELRTPLTSIQGYLSVFLKENASKLEPEQKMFLDRVDDSAKQLLILVENILNVNKIERGGITINMQPIDWAALLEETVNELKSRAHEKQIELIYEKPTQAIPSIMADKVRIKEVLINLITNAIKYTQETGEIKVSAEIKNNDVITHVKDNGPGIAKSAQNYLFSKFYRVNSHLEQTNKGNGLGLYISRAIIELHHGRIWVQSEVGKGSEFSFSLPL